MKTKNENQRPSPENLMNEGLGNQEKFQSKTYRKLSGKIDPEEVESIDKAERKDTTKTDE